MSEASEGGESASLGYWCDKCRRADRWTEFRLTSRQTLCDPCADAKREASRAGGVA